MLSPSLLWLRYESCRKVAVLQSFFATLLALDICLVCGGAGQVVGVGRRLRRGGGGDEVGRGLQSSVSIQIIDEANEDAGHKINLYILSHHPKTCQVKVDMAETS
jgi:hypothetical protein